MASGSRKCSRSIRASAISRYLVARAMVRDERRAEALAQLEALLADPAWAAVHGMAKDLRDHLVWYLDPATRHREVRELLAAPELPAAAASPVLTRELRAYLTGVAWSRAALLGDPATASALTERLAELVPELGEDLAAWRDAAPDERDFVTALVSLRHSGLHPDVHTQLGQLADLDGDWWCDGSRFPVDPEAPLPSFVAPAGSRRAATAALVALPSAPIHLGGLVLSHADLRPDDPRLPEALHHVVHGTRYGCDRGTYGEISRAAFERLHRDYPKSPWTAKTPYWFE